MTPLGLQFAIQYRIIAKLKNAGATSKEKAVTAKEAKLDPQEKKWLGYFAGAFLGKIKKTRNKRYYI